MGRPPLKHSDVSTIVNEINTGLRYVCIYTGKNSRAELVILAPGLRLKERRWFGDTTEVLLLANSLNFACFGP